MRKLIVGLMVVGLLGVGAPAMAQQADPLGLISSGAVLPFVGEGTIAPGSISFLEVASPREDNQNLHMFFFDKTCKRQGQSVGLPLTTNDVEILRVDDIGGATPTEGLLTLGQAASGGFTLQPLPEGSPIHARVLWVNGVGDYIRILEPIAISNFDLLTKTWNPLRSAATFWAPPVTPGFLNTTIYFVCPTPDITSAVVTDPVTGTPAFSSNVANPGGPFPVLDPPAAATTSLRFRIYDDEEKFLRDVRSTCQCLTPHAVTEISDIYSKAPNGTYTEVEGDVVHVGGTSAQCSTTVLDCGTGCPGGNCGAVTSPDCPVDTATGCHFLETQKPVGAHDNSFSFTGYRAISVTLGSQGLDAFGRLSNGASCSISDDSVGCTARQGER